MSWEQRLSSGFIFQRYVYSRLMPIRFRIVTLENVFGLGLNTYYFLFRRYWNDFLSCTSASVADCQDEAVELWEKLKVPSGNLNYRGSLFQLCSRDNGASGLRFKPELIVWATCLVKLVILVIF